ncbi:MAG: urease accessory protein UreF [Rhodobacteraceae bacterium]|nr:urease accessory protein UreF [Paracoccaceae bacterium]
MSESGLLALVQWLSPSFPLGSFAWSQGLEWAIAEGHVSDRAALETWLGDLIDHGGLGIDAVLVARALDPGADHEGLAATARALAPTRERLAETEEQGAALSRTVAALTGQALPAAPLPVALGRAAAPLGLPAERVVALYLQSAASALVLAAVRFVPLGQTEGQAALAALAPRIEAAARRALETPLSGLGSAALGADMASAWHEDMEVRIFKS